MDPKALITLLVLVVVVAFPLFILIRKRYKIWVEAATKSAFHQVDSDNSGSIDAEELYSSVLALYLCLNQYGIYVIAPERPVVDQIMKEIDARGSGDGTLDYQEFSEAIEVLTAGAASRVVTTIILTAVCPLLASYTISAIVWAWTSSAVDLTTLPLWLRASLELVPGWLPETLLATVLLMLRPFAQDAVAALVRGFHGCKKPHQD